jgi:hypothetical protein
LALRSSQRFTNMTSGVLPFFADVDTSIHQVDYGSLLSWAIWLWNQTFGPHLLTQSLIAFLVTSCLSSLCPGEEIKIHCKALAYNVFLSMA